MKSRKKQPKPEKRALLVQWQLDRQRSLGWHDRTKEIFESGIDRPIDVDVDPSSGVECSGRIL
jgi:hypothetical protein